MFDLYNVMSIDSKEAYSSVLKSNNCEVVFEKSDGTERTMLCTLQEDVLPAATGSTNNRKVNNDVISVWDLDKNSWRSFRIDSVKDFAVVNK